MHDRLTYSVEQAAALLGISRGKAYHCIRTGELHAVPLGRRLVVPAHVVDAPLGLGEPQAAPPDVINEVEVSGRLTRPPEERLTRTGNRMATLRLAVGGREHPVFIDVVAFGELAEEAVILTKGQRVCVAGRLDQRDWTTEDGFHRSTHQIVARRVEALEPPRRRRVSVATS
jgi:single-strand DNA-binding protein